MHDKSNNGNLNSQNLAGYNVGTLNTDTNNGRLS